MAIADRRGREKEQRRNTIIDAAEKLFFSRGFDNVSMEDIAKEVELGKGTLYLYFKSKDSLFFAIIFRRWMDLGESITEKVSHGKTGLEKVQIMIRSLIEYARENADYTDMFTTFWPQISLRMGEEDAQTMRETAMKYMPRVHNDVVEGIEDGSVRNDLDPRLLGIYVEMITFYIITPNPSAKCSFEAQGISYDTYVEMLPQFLCPAVARYSKKECGGQDQ
ncbi:TetR/AcrR family transcriptional regulator [uncultured Methanomethylovorans sp.]|uniref:TetR/AcrR family transcriptional regulator n=1 Tax=uncultured Methanomethylovorans sp. TaxID=183759 RepID=UPI002AA72331|nr:TetR/AcrR family transcriptional regulator [uncultured Methanomethylovorans sp.]